MNVAGLDDTELEGIRGKGAGPAAGNSDVKMMARAMVQSVKQAIHDAVAPEAARISALEARILELEGAQQKNLADAYQGAWLPARTYKRGCLVQHGGAAWLALDDCSGKPGEAEGWRLLVKAR